MSTLTVLFVLAFGLLCGINASSSPPAPAPEKTKPTKPSLGVVCNKTNYTSVYPTNSYVKHVLGQLSDEVSNSKGYAKLIKFPEIDMPIMSGQGTCLKKMSQLECANCIKDAAKKLLDSCPQRLGAQFTATGCTIRYEVFNA
ncbi:hypothetical protein LINPERPRIM_LOCUS33598 [Linum perenne]